MNLATFKSRAIVANRLAIWHELKPVIEQLTGKTAKRPPYGMFMAHWTAAQKAAHARRLRAAWREQRVFDLWWKAKYEAEAQGWPSMSIAAHREQERRAYWRAHDDSGDWEWDSRARRIVRVRHYGVPL